MGLEGKLEIVVGVPEGVVDVPAEKVEFPLLADGPEHACRSAQRRRQPGQGLHEFAPGDHGSVSCVERAVKRYVMWWGRAVLRLRFSDTNCTQSTEIREEALETNRLFPSQS